MSGFQKKFKNIRPRIDDRRRPLAVWRVSSVQYRYTRLSNFESAAKYSPDKPWRVKNSQTSYLYEHTKQNTWQRRRPKNISKRREITRDGTFAFFVFVTNARIIIEFESYVSSSASTTERTFRERVSNNVVTTIQLPQCVTATAFMFYTAIDLGTFRPSSIDCRTHSCELWRDLTDYENVSRTRDKKKKNPLFLSVSTRSLLTNSRQSWLVFLKNLVRVLHISLLKVHHVVLISDRITAPINLLMFCIYAHRQFTRVTHLCYEDSSKLFCDYRTKLHIDWLSVIKDKTCLT